MEGCKIGFCGGKFLTTADNNGGTNDYLLNTNQWMMLLSQNYYSPVIHVKVSFGYDCELLGMFFLLLFL